MAMLPRPWEILEMRDGETREFRILRWELGEIQITPRYPGAQGPKTVQALRIHVPEDVKPTLPHYWDITATTLIAGLLPYLRSPDYREKVFTVRKIGVRPTARFTLKVSPAA